MKLSICIVNFNSGGLLKKCLDSIERFPPGCGYEIIIADNNSTDGSRLEALAHNSVKLIENDRNAGYAVANNQIFALARGDYFLLLNADTEIRSGSLDALLACAEANTGAGLISAKLVNPDGTAQVGFNVRRFPGMASAAAQLLLLDEIRPMNRLTRTAGCFDMDYAKFQSVEQPAASALLFRRATWEKIGGFDEQFLNWYNDVDLCRRVKEGGWDILYCPDSEIMHYGGMGGASREITDAIVELYRSQRLYFKKYFGWRGYVLLNIGIIIGMMLRVLAVTFGPGLAGRVSSRARQGRPHAVRAAFVAVLKDTLHTWHNLPELRLKKDRISS